MKFFTAAEVTHIREKSGMTPEQLDSMLDMLPGDWKNFERGEYELEERDMMLIYMLHFYPQEFFAMRAAVVNPARDSIIPVDGA